MATVRINARIADAIVQRAIHKTQLLVQANDKSISFPYDGDTFYDMLFAPWRAHMDALPSAFFHTYTTIDVVNAGSISTPFKRLHIAPSKFPLSAPLGSDFVIRQAYRGSVDVVLLHSDRWQQIITDVSDWKARHDRLIEGRDKLVRGVKDVLTKHSNLNAAVKTWPALWDLIPENIQDEMRTEKPKGQRAQAERPQLSADLDQMTGILAASKFV